MGRPRKTLRVLHTVVLFGLLFATDDRREGMDAFLAKRSPKFTGR